MDVILKKTLARVAQFYDERKVGDVGPLGFRRSTDLLTLLACMDRLARERVLVPGRTLFFDLGCADGRVNALLSYVARLSVGVEIDAWTLEEYEPLKTQLQKELEKESLPPPPRNIHLFHGDSTDEGVHRAIRKRTGLVFEEFDLFYTYLVMHEEFAALLSNRAKKGSFFMVYGLGKILPTYPGFRLLESISPMESILAIYEKE